MRHILSQTRGTKKTRGKSKKSVDKRENLWYIYLALARSKCLTRKGFLGPA